MKARTLVVHVNNDQWLIFGRGSGEAAQAIPGASMWA